jgi:hypothetical protein
MVLTEPGLAGMDRSKTKYHLALGGRAEVQQPWCDFWYPTPSLVGKEKTGWDISGLRGQQRVDLGEG